MSTSHVNPKYRTRSRGKVEGDDKVESIVNTTAHHLGVSTTVKKTRSRTIGTTSKTLTVPKKDVDSISRKPVKTTRTQSNKVEAQAKVTRKTRTTTTKETMVKKVTFGNVQESAQQDGYCPSEDDLVAVTPHKPKSIMKSTTKTEQPKPSRKRQLEDSSDAPTSNSRRVKLHLSEPTEAGINRQAHKSKVASTKPAMVLRRPRNRAFRVVDTLQPPSFSADEDESGVTDTILAGSMVKRRQVSKALHPQIPVQQSQQPLHTLSLSGSTAMRQPRSSVLDNKKTLSKQDHDIEPSTQSPVKRNPSPIKSQSSSSRSIIEDKQMTSPIKRATFRVSVNKDNEQSKILSTSISSPPRRHLTFDKALLPNTNNKLPETHFEKTSRSPLRSPVRKSVAEVTISPERQQCPPSTVKRRPHHATLAKENKEAVKSASRDNLNGGAQTGMKGGILSQSTTANINENPHARSTVPSASCHFPDMTEENMETVDQDDDKPHVVRKLFDTPVHTPGKPAFEVYSEEDVNSRDIVMEDVSDFAPIKELKDITASEQAHVDPLISRFSDFNFDRRNGEDCNDPQTPSNERRTTNYVNDENAVPIDPLLFPQNGINGTMHKVQIIALKPPSEESPTRQGTYSSVKVARGHASKQPLNLDLTSPYRLLPSKEKSSRKSILEGPLSGTTIFVDVHTSEGADASSSFVDSLTALGAKCVKQWTWSLSKEFEGGIGLPDMEKIGITHVVFKDGSPRTLQKVKDTRGGVFCVGIAWALE